MKRKGILVLVLLILVSTADLSAYGQPNEDTILLGMQLRLGMSEDFVLKKLRESYDVQQLGTNSWFIRSKDRPAFVIFGTIGFDSGKLTFISKSWTPYEAETATDLAKAMFGAIAQVEREGNVRCVIHADHQQTPELEVKSVNFSCGRKTISVDIFLSKSGGEKASITERLGEAKKL